MRLSDVESVVTQAIQSKQVIEVQYVHKEDGMRSTRLMEPFDVARGQNSPTGPMMLWAWCLFHNRIEQKLVSNIISIRLTDDHFDPKSRERTFKTPTRYRIPRTW